MFRRGWIGFMCSMFENRMSTVLELHELTEQTINTEKLNFQTYLEQEAKGLEEDIKQEFFEFHQDEYFKYRDDFPTISRSSLFLSSFFALENFLHELCMYLEKHSDLKIEDAKDNGILKYKNFLKQFTKDDHFFGTKTWQKIIFYRDLRNAFAHANGDLRLSTNPKLKDTILKEVNLVITERDDILIKEEFLVEVTSTLNAFSKALYEQLKH